MNDQAPNAMTLHTSAGCTMPGSRAMTGVPTLNDCDVAANGNSGCGVQAPTTNSYGPQFNANGGGIYATERTSSFIKVWFFPRNSNIPSDLRDGASAVNTDNWVGTVYLGPVGEPSANRHATFFDPGHADCAVPEQPVRYRQPLRRAQHHHQPHFLCVFIYLFLGSSVGLMIIARFVRRRLGRPGRYLQRRRVLWQLR